MSTINTEGIDAATGKKIIYDGDDVLAGTVPPSRQVIAGPGLIGGGPLSSDVTLALAGGTPPNPPNTVLLFDDFVHQFDTSSVKTTPFFRGTNGTGSTGNAASSNDGVDTTNKADGVIQLSVSTNGDQYLWMSSENTTIGRGQITIEWRVRHDQALDAGVNYINFGVGLYSTTSYGSSNKISFQGDYSNGYETVTMSGGVQTRQTFTGNTPTTSWNVFKIVINAAASSVDFYLNGTLVNTHTTNIPAAGTLMRHGAVIYKLASNSSRSIFLDYAKILTEYSSSR